MSEICIRKGDILNIREQDIVETSKHVINTYEVESIPKHNRFVVCIYLKNDARTGIRKTFDRLDLKKKLIWGGTKVEKKAERKKAETEILEKPVKQYKYDELIRYCKRNKVKNYRKKNKKELLELIEGNKEILRQSEGDISIGDLAKGSKIGGEDGVYRYTSFEDVIKNEGKYTEPYVIASQEQ